jgi:hypothetical protein
MQVTECLVAGGGSRQAMLANQQFPAVYDDQRSRRSVDWRRKR